MVGLVHHLAGHGVLDGSRQLKYVRLVRF